MGTFPLFPSLLDPLRRRKPTGLSNAAMGASQGAQAQVGLLPLPPLARNNDGILSPSQQGGQWDDTAGLLGPDTMPRDTVGANETGYISSLPNAVQRPDLNQILAALAPPPTPPQMAALPTRDRGQEAKRTIEGAGILSALALLTGNRGVAPAAIGQFVGNAGNAYDQQASDQMQRAQMDNQQALQGHNLQRQAVGDANDAVQARANAALQQYRTDQDAFNDANTRRDKIYQQGQDRGLKQQGLDLRAAHDASVASAKKIAQLFNFAARAGGRLTPDGEAALSQAIKDAGGAQNLPADFLSQLSEAEKAQIAQKDQALKQQLYGIETRDARAAAGQAETAQYHDILASQGDRRLAQSDTRIGIQQGREARLSTPGASGKVDGFTPNQVESQRRQTQSELDKLVAQKRSFGQYADQARAALASGTIMEKGKPRPITDQERATFQSAIQQAHQLLPDIDNRIQSARGRLQDWNTRSQQIQRASRVGSDDGAPTDPSQLEQWIGRSTGPNGCARAVCQIAKGLGIPVPQTESAGGMEQALQRGVKSGAWVQVPVGQAQTGDIVVSTGNGPSGRHVTMATGDGRTIGNPGSKSGYRIAYRNLPTGDGSARAFRYVGPPRGANESPAAAENNVTPKPVPNGTRPPQHRATTGQYATKPLNVKGSSTGDLLQRLADKYKNSGR